MRALYTVLLCVALVLVAVLAFLGFTAEGMTWQGRVLVGYGAAVAVVFVGMAFTLLEILDAAWSAAASLEKLREEARRRGRDAP